MWEVVRGHGDGGDAGGACSQDPDFRARSTLWARGAWLQDRQRPPVGTCAACTGRRAALAAAGMQRKASHTACLTFPVPLRGDMARDNLVYTGPLLCLAHSSSGPCDFLSNESDMGVFVMLES